MKLKIEYGEGFIDVNCEHPVDVRGMAGNPEAIPLPQGITDALKNPINSPSLLEIGRGKLESNPDARAVIVVSDNTRPVPYRGEQGIMRYIIRTLLEAGFSQPQITVIIGAGSHRNMEADEIELMLGLQESGLGEVNVTNHGYDNDDHLVYLGTTSRGSKVTVNRQYYEADLKIVTGLVESHFMAGASGGRKGICPGIVGIKTLKIFHGAKFLSSAKAADLVLAGNPLSDESLEVAQMAGCDFLVNTTLDADKRMTGVYAGDLVEAHRAAVQKIREYVVVPLPHRYDIVIIPAGFVGINHYQAGKAAIEAARAVKPGGKIIIVAKNTDTDPVGGRGYKQSLKLLAKYGKTEFLRMISDPQWQMIQEQWQVQMWSKVLTQIEREDNLIYCALEIPDAEYEHLPGVPGFQLLDPSEWQNLTDEEKITRITEAAIQRAIDSSRTSHPSIVLLKDGPYGIPEVAKNPL
ncbi:MAG: nickel-dependent lactate racemase [Cyclobacteriaceae bacterium]